MSENIASFEKFIKTQWEYTVYIFQFWKNNFSKQDRAWLDSSRSHRPFRIQLPENSRLTLNKFPNRGKSDLH